MGLIYFPYIAILFVLAIVLCQKQKQPKWWAGVILVLPPAATVLIVKSKLKRSKLFVLFFAVSFIIAISGEAFLYLGKKAKAADIVPPIIKKVIQLNKDVEQTTIDIYNTSGKLHSISLSQSRIGDLQTSIKVIENIRELVEKNYKAIDKLIAFIEDHQTFFIRKNLAWILPIKTFYSNDHVVQHHKSREQYLAAFEVQLKYTYKNFQNIMERQSTQHMQSYDVYYMRYRRAADAHNRFNRKRIAFQNSFVQKYPEVKPFLPGSHHHAPFKFWDKFQF